MEETKDEVRFGISKMRSIYNTLWYLKQIREFNQELMLKYFDDTITNSTFRDKKDKQNA
jgi:hypothetical protein